MLVDPTARVTVDRATSQSLSQNTPWHGHTLVGTTDTAIDAPGIEPRAFPQEVDFILETAGLYLHRAPTRADVTSVFVGIRPLVRSGDAKSTAALSRDHTIHIDASGQIKQFLVGKSLDAKCLRRLF